MAIKFEGNEYTSVSSVTSVRNYAVTGIIVPHAFGIATDVFGIRVQSVFGHGFVIQRESDGDVVLYVSDDLGTTTTSPLTNIANDEAFFFFVQRHQGDQITHIYWRSAGESTFGTNHVTVDRTGAFPDPVTFVLDIGNRGNEFDQTAANVKVWSKTTYSDCLTTIQALAELTSLDPIVTTDLYGSYKFANGALTTDSSGGGHSLTETGTPIYINEPADSYGRIVNTIAGQFPEGFPFRSDPSGFPFIIN